MTRISQKILESKAALRRELGSQSIADKLRMLDCLRERQLAIEPAKKRLRGEKTNARERR